MMCLGKGATGFTSPSGSEMSAFLTSFRRYPVKKKLRATISKTHKKIQFKGCCKAFKYHKQPLNNTGKDARSDSVLFSSLNLIL